MLLIQFNCFDNSSALDVGYKYCFVSLILGWKLYTVRSFARDVLIKFHPSTKGVQTVDSSVGAKERGV